MLTVDFGHEPYCLCTYVRGRGRDGVSHKQPLGLARLNLVGLPQLVEALGRVLRQQELEDPHLHVDLAVLAFGRLDAAVQLQRRGLADEAGLLASGVGHGDAAESRQAGQHLRQCW